MTISYRLLKNTRRIFTKRILLFILLFIVQNGFSQNNVQEKADDLFSQLLYAKAIPEYEELLKSRLNTNYVHQRLAECHLKMRNVEKAIPHLKVVVLSATPQPSKYYLMYGMALRTTGDSKGAERWLTFHESYSKTEVKTKKNLKNDALTPVVFNTGEHYEVEPVHFNSPLSDFGVYAKNNKIYFASARIDNEEADEEELYGWNNEPWLDIYMLNENDPFGKPIPLPGNVNSDYHESSMVFSINHEKDTVLYFTGNKYFKFTGKNYSNKTKKKDRDAALNLKIFSAIKKSGKWLVNQDLTINSPLYSTGHPYITPDGKRIYFASNRLGGYGGSDIYYAQIHERGGLGKAINAGPIVNTEGNEMFPFLNKKGKLFFTSDGHVGFGQQDLFSSVLNEENEIIDVINLGNSINTGADDFAYFEHDSGGTGYFSSNREGGAGSDDIYKFKFTPALSIRGIVVDEITKQPLDSVTVRLYDQTNNTKITELLTDKNGYYKTVLNRNSAYKIEAVRKTHPTKFFFIETHEVLKTTKQIQQNLTLEPIINLNVLTDLNRINFDFDKSDIRPDIAFELNKVVKLMTVTYPKMIIRIEALTATIGSNIDNDLISSQRAKAVHDYLIEHGVFENNILSYKGFGKQKSINDCDGSADCTNEELEMIGSVKFSIVQLRANTHNLSFAR